MSNLEAITVRGARVNNLKNITFSIPFNQLTVVTGVSGSGKSSLAFDTIYAEGQRRYVESLSAYARQFLERMDKPDIDEALGICPAIAINQKNSTRNPRSTVATQTEIYDYLRLLFARVGVTRCRNCGAVVKRDTPESITDEVMQLPEGTRFYVLFPASAGTEFIAEEATGVSTATGKERKPKARKNAKSAINVKAHLMSLMQRGFTRLYDAAKNEVIELQTPDSFTGKSFDNVFVLVDRLAIRADTRSRLTDSVETCYREGHGQAVIQTTGDNPQQFFFSEKFQCKNCKLNYVLPEPQLFSFNNPFGACPTCQGFGNTIGLDLNLVIPNRELSLAEGAIEPFTKPQFENWRDELKTFAKREGISMTAPFASLSPEQQEAVIEGKNDFGGVVGLFDYLETKKYKLHVRVLISKYRGYARCPDCKGGRLRQEARDVYVGEKNLPDVVRLSIKDARAFFDRLRLTEEQAAIADRLLKEIRSRLRFLDEVGLDYLSLDRLASTLSGGEAQRIQLATHLGSSLVGALYVLDEPSIGLHPRDSARLIGLLENLRDIGNTVLVVEHEAEMMRAADYILDIGPGAGELGGEVIYEGNFNNLLKDEHSLTGKYLRGETQIKTPKEHYLSRGQSGKHQLSVRGARAHNLKNIDVTIPLEAMVCITGVSGSGKSTLIHECLYAGLKKQRGDWTGAVGDFAAIEGGKFLDDIILVDQSPIGRTPRSNPVTYIKAYDLIREAFAETREAQARGYNPGHFSFNVPGGRCDVCEGDGTVTVEMQFLADVELVCEECGGKRFKQSVLDVKYRGKNIHEVLNLTVREAIGFFSQAPRIAAKLKVLEDVGLGYLRLGQSATTLSGGEAQRVKLASYMSKKAGDHSLYIFDEPTTGLHFDDINKLLASFRRLLETGASLIVIEHNLDVIKTADWIIDLGPEGGVGGGQVVAVGTPEEIMQVEASYTGRYLKAHLESR
ncbi:MAG TPA: excinuclease ABC subunit UvrA [Blastocatellia bacterium]|nr:excinuclease ABC subunit UvrA [Blastocatellia bacterium]HMY70805.1 excinuclease ABC subunit UvrA [Blastocatellia bacterium]HNG30606.1 excinuclease ABC subunit UvrA [Blastocatellia bacterium]